MAEEQAGGGGSSGCPTMLQCPMRWRSGPWAGPDEVDGVKVRRASSRALDGMLKRQAAPQVATRDAWVRREAACVQALDAVAAAPQSRVWRPAARRRLPVQALVPDKPQLLVEPQRAAVGHLCLQRHLLAPARSHGRDGALHQLAACVGRGGGQGQRRVGRAGQVRLSSSAGKRCAVPMKCVGQGSSWCVPRRAILAPDRTGAPCMQAALPPTHTRGGQHW